MRFFEIFLALRYIKPKRNFISVLSFLSILGPALGVAVLIVVIAVMSGFDRDIKSRILSMQSHLTVRGLRDVMHDQNEIIKKIESAGNIKAAPVLEGSILVQTRSGVSPEMLIGIDLEREKNVSELKNNIKEGTYEIGDNEVIIGDRMARKYGLRLGNKFVVHSLEKLGKNIEFNGSTPRIKENPSFALPNELTIAGIFQMGLNEYDSSIMFANLDTAAEIFGQKWGAANKIKVNTQNPFDATRIKEELSKNLPFNTISTWMEDNQILFGALKMEKNMMFFLLFFIVLVAAFGIAGTLLTFAMQKNKEMAVLKALGATPSQIMRIFLLLGLIVGMLATALGTILGILIVIYRDNVADLLSKIKGSEVFPPELYHLTKIPGMLNPSDVVIIFLGSLFLCIFAATLPAMFAAWTNPANALKSQETL